VSLAIAAACGGDDEPGDAGGQLGKDAAPGSDTSAGSGGATAGGAPATGGVTGLGGATTGGVTGLGGATTGGAAGLGGTPAAGGGQADGAPPDGSLGAAGSASLDSGTDGATNDGSHDGSSPDSDGADSGPTYTLTVTARFSGSPYNAVVLILVIWNQPEPRTEMLHVACDGTCQYELPFSDELDVFLDSPMPGYGTCFDVTTDSPSPWNQGNECDTVEKGPPYSGDWWAECYFSRYPAPNRDTLIQIDWATDSC
jgi:hypothetical protein